MTILYHDYDKVHSNKNAEVIVVWSGGCDSTLMLKEVSERYGTVTSPVVAISINHYLLHSDKLEREKEFRQKALIEFKNRGLHIIHHEIDITSNMDVSDTNYPVQSFIWLTLLIPYLKNNCNLYFGFIRSDDILLYLEKFKNMIKSMEDFTNKTINLCIPYQYTYKKDILKELMDSDLYNMTWYCEAPKNKKICKTCAPCKTHELAMIELCLNEDARAIKYLPKQLKYIKNDKKK